mmetsp:Transcript_16011/g.35871  ORF Transcript_16011/g.35871 Transcript_16011/m.35871 type:complete len:155 (+) Transcript_16011:794-1258(+)
MPAMPAVGRPRRPGRPGRGVRRGELPAVVPAGPPRRARGRVAAEVPGVDVDVDGDGMVRGEGRRTAYCLFYNRVEGSTRGSGNGTKTTVIRRQSTSRPELWPHLQRDQMRVWTSVKPFGGGGVPEVDYYFGEEGADFDDGARGPRQLTRISEGG